MTAVSRSFTLLLLPFLLLTSCASVRKDFVDPSFKAQGLEGSAVTLKCISPVGMPHGLAPQHEHEILDDARLGILARHKNVQIVPEATGGTGGIKPAYAFEVHVTHDDTEQKVKRYRGSRSVGRTRSVYINVTRVRVWRTVSAKYVAVHLPSGRVVWQASGEGSRSARYRLNLLNYYGRPELRPNMGPALPEVLRPVTRKACARLP